MFFVFVVYFLVHSEKGGCLKKKIFVFVFIFLSSVSSAEVSNRKSKSVTYDVDLGQFVIVSDRKFVFVVDIKPLVSKDKSVNVGVFPYKYSEVFGDEK